MIWQHLAVRKVKVVKGHIDELTRFSLNHPGRGLRATHGLQGGEGCQEARLFFYDNTS